jgi:hypothetical protein
MSISLKPISSYIILRHYICLLNINNFSKWASSCCRLLASCGLWFYLFNYLKYWPIFVTIHTFGFVLLELVLCVCFVDRCLSFFFWPLYCFLFWFWLPLWYHQTPLVHPSVFNGVRVTRSLVLCPCFVDPCLSFCRFSFDHCVVYPLSIYGFWLPL